MEQDAGFMNWVDSVREQMADVANRAQESVADPDSGVAFRRRYDELIKQLGELVYTQYALGDNEQRSAGISAIELAIDELLKQHDVIDIRDHTAVKANN